ncbi:hypothetical protein ABPG75_003079 [Micractinium tetrahymenae]
MRWGFLLSGRPAGPGSQEQHRPDMGSGQQVEQQARRILAAAQAARSSSEPQRWCDVLLAADALLPHVQPGSQAVADLCLALNMLLQHCKSGVQHAAGGLAQEALGGDTVEACQQPRKLLVAIQALLEGSAEGDGGAVLGASAAAQCR